MGSGARAQGAKGISWLPFLLIIIGRIITEV